MPFRAAAASVASSGNPAKIFIPAGAVVGDTAVLFGGYNGTSTTKTATGHDTWTPCGPGWVLSTSSAGSVWTSPIASGDAGTEVDIDNTSFAKLVLVLLVYSGISASTPLDVALASNTVSSTSPSASHVVPTTVAAVTAGAICLECVIDKGNPPSSVFTPPAGFTTRSSIYGSGTGSVSMFVAERNTTVTAGATAGGETYTGDQSNQQVNFTLLLRPLVTATAPTAAFTTSVSTLTLTVNGSTSTAVSPATISSYAWTYGDGGTATGATPAAHTYSTAGSKTVILTVTDSNGLTNSVSHTVTVGGPVAAFTSTVTGPTVAFDSSTSTVVSPATIATRAWDFGDGVTTTGTTVSHKYTSAGTVTVSLTITDSNGATSVATQSVTIAAPSGIVSPVTATGAGYTPSTGTLLQVLTDGLNTTYATSLTAAVLTATFAWTVLPGPGQGLIVNVGADRLTSSSGSFVAKLYTDAGLGTLVSTAAAVTILDGTASGSAVTNPILQALFPAADVSGLTDGSNLTVTFTPTLA
jgi:PKD repeat protein